MDWLAGALAGGLIGFRSALGVVEFAAWRERGGKTVDTAKLLFHEVSRNEARIEGAVSKVTKAVERHVPKRMTGPAFARAAFDATIRDVPLLPKETCDLVLHFHACLHDIEHVEGEWRLLESAWPVGERRPAGVIPLLKGLRSHFKELAEVGLQISDGVLAELWKVRGVIPPDHACDQS